MLRSLIAAAILAPCLTVSLAAHAAPAAAGTPAAVATPDPGAFDACLARLRGEAAQRGIDGETWNRHTRGLAPDASVLESLDYQPEFKTPIWDYLAALVDDERIAQGRERLLQWYDTLRAIEARYGVDPATVVAVWGVESNYGQRFGGKPIVTSLATLSCFGRRQPYFRGELFSALGILRDGHVGAEKLVGSWAGAFGHTQFMPSTFTRTAVDFDGDGRRDIVDSVPDALASTANFLVQAGWRRGEPWGFEVKLPAGFDATVAGRRNKRALADWIATGVRRVDGRPIDAVQAGLAPATPAAVLLPAARDALTAGNGAQGPAFIVLRNFDAIYRYNAAESYALAIAHLADQLRGGAAFVTPWPTDDLGLGRSGRRELQERLAAKGHDIGEIDGLVGSRTRAAIRAEERRLGLPESGRAGTRLLDALRSGR